MSYSSLAYKQAVMAQLTWEFLVEFVFSIFSGRHISNSKFRLTNDVEVRVREQGLSIMQNLTTTQTEIAYLITELTAATITDVLHASIASSDGDIVLRVGDICIYSICLLMTASRQRIYCLISFRAQMSTESSFWVHAHFCPTSVLRSHIHESMFGGQR